MDSKNKKNKITLKKILRRPIVRLVIIIIVIIIAVFAVKSFGNKKKVDSDKIEGYQKLVNITDGKYTYIDLEGRVKTYEGYSSMDDFYFDTTCVSKSKEDKTSQMALIDKNNKEVVPAGTYEDITQVVGGKYYKVEKDNKNGIIDYKGNEIIKPEYEYISITTVQEAEEVVFECQKEGKYYILNESGKTLLETDNKQHSISYASKFNEEYDTIIYISIDGAKRYFDLVTAEELFKDTPDANVSYNILKTDSKLAFYDKKGKLKTEFENSGDKMPDARVYFKKYILIDRKTSNTDSKESRYTIYDSDFKKVLESDTRITPVQDDKDNIYFLINEMDGLKIINEKNKEIKVEGYEFNASSISDLQYLVLNKIGDSAKYDLYNFEGKQVLADINEYTQKGCGLLIGKYDESKNLVRTLVLGKLKQINLSDRDNVVANDYYITIEDGVESKISVVDFDGNVTVDKVPGVKVFFTEKYIGVQEKDTVNIYDVKSGKVTFTYQVNNYVNRDEISSYVELTDGYYGFDGKTILKKDAQK